MNISSQLANQSDSFTEAIESYYLETQEGLFFTVKGLEHPPDRWIAVLRYAPDPSRGERKKNGKTYRRLYSFAEQEQWITTACPQYISYDPVFQAPLQSVPKSMVRHVYDPRLLRLELAKSPAEKGIEKDAAAFASLLQKEAGVPEPAIGITGSLLIGMHTEFSDLDIVVFGTESCNKVHRALEKLLESESCAQLRRLDAQGVKELYTQRVKDTHMDFHEFASLEKYKVNQGSFRNRTYFIRFVKEAEEGATYGHLRYTPLGRAAITASIAGSQEAIFTPCRYLLSNVRSLEGALPPDLKEAVSFRGRFCEQAQEGDSIMAAGVLERIQNNTGDVWHRLLLGNFPEDVMVLRR